MKFGFAEQVTEKVSESNLGKIISDVGQSLQEFLSIKSYGSLKEFGIGIICVSPEFDPFFKVRKPEYIGDTRTEVRNGNEYEFSNILTYNIKLSYEEYIENSGTNDEIRKKFIETLNFSLENIRKVKILDFNTDAFIADVSAFLEAQV